MRHYLFLLFFSMAGGQNLVSNPGFENFTECPSANTFNVSDWYRVINHSGTVDYFNICAPYGYVSIPSSYWGYQTPHEGNAYMGASFYNPGNELREYAQTQLLIPLQEGQYYYISFFVCLTDISGQAVNEIGAVLTTLPLQGQNNYKPINAAPAIKSTTIISDKDNWTQIAGNYQASGGETYLTIGQFVPDNNSSIAQLSEQDGAYYLIDDVSIVAVDPPISDINCLDILNPVYESLHIENSSAMEIYNMVIIDMAGRTIIRNVVNSELYFGDLQKGIYIINYECNGKSRYLKVIKI